MSSLNPLTWSLEQLSRWVDQALVQVADNLFRQVVFAPIQWSTMASDLYRTNLRMALAGLCLGMVWTLIQHMWPIWGVRIVGSSVLSLERTVTAALMAVAALPVIRGLLEVNDDIVKSFTTHLPTAVVTSSSPLELSLNPLLTLALGAIVLGLLVYLGVFYALRTVEVYILTGLIPWFMVLWANGRDDGWLGNLSRELLVAIFVQCVHAMIFWLFVQMAVHTSSLADEFFQAGVLWYMTKIPDQMRRLFGATGSRGRLLPWM
ncbi:MAG: hypothetical protein M1318_08045 [Firmicutes bacterium]|nr:hypothetical protein [Bacillota bacterium]